MYRAKEDILLDFPELELTNFGDFKIKDELVKDFHIIDFHCHLFDGVRSFIPKPFRHKKIDLNASLFDLSCYPISRKYFDFNKELFTTYPDKLFSFGGMKLAWELSGLGGFIGALQRSTPERMLRDMELNHVSKAVVLQLNTVNCDSLDGMAHVLEQYDNFYTFGSIHPHEQEVETKIQQNLEVGVKGWKIAPHVNHVNIDDPSTVRLLKHLAETTLPIISCSGLAFPKDKLSKVPRKLRRTIETQNIHRFSNLLKEIPDATFIFGHSGLYQLTDVIELMGKYPHTYADISTQPPASIRRLIEEVGSKRLLYGTDYPAFNHAFPIVSVLRATDDTQERKDILGENAKRLLNIEK